MSDKQSFTREEYLADVRGANGTRAQWFHLMLQEAEKHGIDPDEFCKATIYAFGVERGRKYAVCEGNRGVHEMSAALKRRFNFETVAPIRDRAFEMELVEKTDERGLLRFHHCPLAATWRSMGLSEERVAELCRLACYSDFARADSANVNLEFGSQIGAGDETCDLIFTPKAEKDGE